MSDTESKLVAATHDFTRGQLDRLDAMRRETGVPRSELVRRAVDLYLAQYERQRDERRALPAELAA